MNWKKAQSNSVPLRLLLMEMASTLELSLTERELLERMLLGISRNIGISPDHLILAHGEDGITLKVPKATQEDELYSISERLADTDASQTRFRAPVVETYRSQGKVPAFNVPDGDIGEGF